MIIFIGIVIVFIIIDIYVRFNSTKKMFSNLAKLIDSELGEIKARLDNIEQEQNQNQ